jgi:hypothetical protein
LDSDLVDASNKVLKILSEDIDGINHTASCDEANNDLEVCTKYLKDFLQRLKYTILLKTDDTLLKEGSKEKRKGDILLKRI